MKLKNFILQHYIICCAAKWISHKDTFTPLLYLISFPFGHHRQWEGFPVLYSRLSLVICFIHNISSVCMSVLISQFIPLSLSLLSVHTFVLYICVSFCFENRFICVIFLDFKYMWNMLVCVLVYDICFFLSDSPHSVWQSLGPSTSVPSVQMAQFHSFLWLSNTALYIHASSSLSIPLLMDI